MAVAIPLIIAAFKVRRLQYVWESVKKFRNTVFPLHMMSRDGIPDLEEGESPPKWIIGRFYWGGPSPWRHEAISDI